MDKELNDIVKRAYEKYKPIKDLYDEKGVSLLEKTLFEELPFIDKEWLSKYEFNEQYAVDIKQLVRVFTTSGTTGGCHFVGFTINDWELQVNNLCESFKLIGINSTDVFYDLIPRTTIFAAYVVLNAVEKIGATVFPAGIMDINKHLEIINRIRPTILNGLAFFILKLGENLDETIRKSIRIICLVGEVLYPETRIQIEELYPNAQIYSGYGISEILTANECIANEGFHYDDNQYIIEVINKNSYGVGELVFTPLRAEAMPLIRYRCGDIGKIIKKPCKCGCALPRFIVLGRQDQMINIKGKLISKNLLKEEVYETIGIKYAFCQYNINKKYNLTLHYVGDINESELISKIKNKFDITVCIIKEVEISSNQWKSEFILYEE